MRSKFIHGLLKFNKRKVVICFDRKDATLRELVDLIKTTVPEAMKKDATFKFSFIEQDLEGNFKRKEIGRVHSVKKSKDDFYTLQEKRFIIGDYIDLCIQTRSKDNIINMHPN